ncbi:MAG: hypothetical protein BMS9Abin31_1226 [Gammaproteobacteria bacterium]|nr:MAG: hypothetical protein BMS9Abin31_1226 [Gammaproteobacteria bacterium]
MKAVMLARIGAVLYILWGILHIVAAYKVFALGQSLEQEMSWRRLNIDVNRSDLHRGLANTLLMKTWLA